VYDRLTIVFDRIFSYTKMITKKTKQLCKRENEHTKKGIKACNVSFVGFNVNHRYWQFPNAMGQYETTTFSKSYRVCFPKNLFSSFLFLPRDSLSLFFWCFLLKKRFTTSDSASCPFTFVMRKWERDILKRDKVWRLNGDARRTKTYTPPLRSICR